jgi:uncharacterized protein (DUF1015 family)
MAIVRPFRALRPVPEAAARVAAVPYDVVSRSEAAALAAGNPLSFLHVSRAEIDLPADMDPYAPDVYRVAADNFRKLRHSAPLVVEENASLYFYRLAAGSHAQVGVAGCYSLDEYDRDIVKKHERTRRDKEDDRTRHMMALRAQTGPVFLTYRAVEEVGAVAGRVTAGPPLIDFDAADGVRHSLWRMSDPDAAAVVRSFAAIPFLYIADGHHRAASAARARGEIRRAALGVVSELAGHRGVGEHDSFLAVAFPDNQMRILPYNRIVRDLAGATPDGFLRQLGARLAVRPGPSLPTRRGEVSMYLSGAWYSVELPEAAAGRDRAAALDVSLLQEQVIEPLLEVGDVRTDKRIDFVGGLRGVSELERLVNSGAAAVAFSMFPVTVADLMTIADAGGIMPPKSTWFEPKLRDGLLSHVI